MHTYIYKSAAGALTNCTACAAGPIPSPLFLITTSQHSRVFVPGRIALSLSRSLFPAACAAGQSLPRPFSFSGDTIPFPGDTVLFSGDTILVDHFSGDTVLVDVIMVESLRLSYTAVCPQICRSSNTLALLLHSQSVCNTERLCYRRTCFECCYVVTCFECCYGTELTDLF